MELYRAPSPAYRIKSAVSANPLGQRTLQHLSVGKADRLVAASSLATITTAAVSAAAITPTATGATWRPLLARTRLIHSHRPAIHGLAVEFRDRILRFLLRTHGHKSKST